ncbi:MAG TPA: winged helix-turn-helix transcriptional regulator [Solirubrobacteraceae bacterium]|jgi:DNA-binding HxlR family transcriptional regulator|nr:winged helix-turn-helix transcriptional regulator [Solirubrobacteraceae bacterium]
MGADREELGLSTLRLLAEDCMLTVLAELSRGPVRTSDIETRAPGIPHWTALRRLQSLADAGFARPLHNTQSRRRRGNSRSSQEPYTLSRLGRENLLQVAAAAAHCEQTWCTPPLQTPDVPGLWVLGLAADQPTRALARALADAPLRTADLQVRLPHVRRSTLLRRLRTLPEHGVLVREEHGGEVRYALTEGARHLVIVPLRAAQCEWRRATPADRARSGDLPGLLHVLAPLGRTPHNTTGTCQWHVDAEGRLQTDVYLAVASGRIAALNAAPVSAPQSGSRATPETWCEALLHGDPSTIATTGDAALFSAVFDALSSALLA